MTLDLPLIWAGVIAVGVLMYVLLDGFDLGVGILFPFAGSPKDRDVMMDSVAPVWDGNETWLVLGGGGLFAAFPYAYAALMPALYIPILLMLMALILRGVAFEYRPEAKWKGLWTTSLCAGSLLAAFCQGAMLGSLVHGLQVNGQNYLVPTDAKVEYEAELDIALIPVPLVMQQLGRGSRERQPAEFSCGACAARRSEGTRTRGVERHPAFGRSGSIREIPAGFPQRGLCPGGTRPDGVIAEGRN